MKVFVTGGSGFVGGHVIERLARSHEVLAMARSERSAATVTKLGARPVSVDLGAITARHLEDVEAVVHAAAYVEEWGSRADFYRANVEGTARVLEAARAARVPRFVHIGTEAVLFDGHDLRDVDESAPYPVRQRYLYSETKAEAERLVLGASSEDFFTTSLRPRLVWGPRDTTVLPVLLRMAEKGKFSWLDGGHHETSTVHVRNVAQAVELALHRGRSGRAYFVADEGTRTYRDFLGALARTRGVTLPERSMPGSIARPFASTIEALWRAFGIRSAPPVTAFAVAMMSRSVTVRTDRARDELGYVPEVSVEQGLAELHGDARAPGVRITPSVREARP